MEQKLNSNSSAGATADSDMQPIVIPSADIAVNPLLAEVLSEYNFTLLKKERFVELYKLDYDNSNNCQGRLLLRVLNDNQTLRLSITETDDDNLFHIIDLFEFKGFGKIHDFMKLVLS